MIEKLKALYERATPGEWEVVESEGKTYIAETMGRNEGYGFTEIAQISEEVDGDGSGDADAYFIALAHNAMPELLAMAGRAQAAENMADDEANYRFFYCDSENSYLLGHRVDNFYYAHWHPRLGWVWDMSRYLPWGETVDGFTYCSEPREIDASTWMRGFCAESEAGNV
jgi:hypothetical protein